MLSETLEAKLLAGASGFDVVVPSLQFLGRQIQAGVFQPLEKERLKNYGGLDPELMERLALQDPGNRYGIPYLWGTTGIGYNVDKVTAAFGGTEVAGSWDLVFKPENMAKLKECGVSFLDSPTEMLPAALQYLGFKPDSQKPDELKKAEALFLSIRPYTAYFHSSKYISDLANGNLCVAVGYSGDLQQSKARAAEAKNGVSLTYTIPKEGAGSFFDMIAIPADAKNVEAAHTFINYLMKPDVMAYITYARGYKGAAINDQTTTVLAPLVVKPEIPKAWEGGVKATLLDGRMVANLAIFRTDVENYQTQFLDSETATYIYGNAPSIHSQGVEI